MKISMWALADALEKFNPILFIKSGTATIRKARFFTGEMNTFADDYVYIGNARDAFSDPQFTDALVLIHRYDTIFICGQPLEIILNEVLATIDRYVEWELKLRALAIEGTLQELVEECGDFLESPIHLMDFGGKVMAEAVHFRTPESDERWQDESVNGIVAKMNSSESFETIDMEPELQEKGPHELVLTNGSRYISAFIFLYDEAIASLYIQENLSPFKPHHLQSASLVWEVITSALKIRGEGTASNFKTLILSELLQGRQVEEENCNQLNDNDWSPPWYLIILRLSEAENRSINAKKLFTRLRGPAYRILALIHEEDALIVVSEDYLEKVLMHLKNLSFTFTADFEVGLSLAFSQWSNLKKAYEQALFALKRSGQREDRIYKCSDYAFDYLVSRMSENNRGFSFSHNAIEILSVYDEKHGTEFLQTLYQYVANERNLVATAKVLFIHRNTLVYRIKRIMEIIGSDLESPEERAFIYFSMKMKFYEEKE